MWSDCSHVSLGRLTVNLKFGWAGLGGLVRDIASLCDCSYIQVACACQNLIAMYFTKIPTFVILEAGPQVRREPGTLPYPASYCGARAQH